MTLLGTWICIAAALIMLGTAGSRPPWWTVPASMLLAAASFIYVIVAVLEW